jgi:hypothetical protein
MKKIEKYLVETSAVRPILGDSTIAQVAHANEETADGTLWSSVYLRMEYIRRWVCDAIRMATILSMCTDVGDALVIIEQDFSPRKVKGAIAVLAKLLREREMMHDTRIAAEELGSMAIRMMEKYDSVFSRRINDKTGCKIGGMKPEIDFNRLLSDLHKFYEAFNTPILDCEINDYLQLDKPKPRIKPLLDDAKTKKLDVIVAMNTLKEDKKWITCNECKKLGDVIIALEQPNSWSLVHLDKSFVDLCRVLEKQNKQIKSVLGLKPGVIP